MIRRHVFELSALAVALSYLGLAFSPANATKDEAKVEASTENSQAKEGQSVRFASIPSSSPSILIASESARVIVKRSNKTSEIVLSSNCPRNWALSGALVRQAGFTGEPRKGTSLLADGLGSRAIVNGRVYLLPSSGMKGLKLSSEGVFIEGKAVDALKGSDIPCNCSGEDLLVLTVPESYSGSLKIGCAGASQIQLDSWKEGALEISMYGKSSLSAGKLYSLAKAAFDNKGQGSIEVSEVDAKIFVANVKGNGSILVKKGKAGMSNATVEGNGSITLHGKFENLKKEVIAGSGKIEVSP